MGCFDKGFPMDRREFLDAEAALRPYRSKVSLAEETMHRDATGTCWMVLP
jgi:hypothetical protein